MNQSIELTFYYYYINFEFIETSPPVVQEPTSMIPEEVTLPRFSILTPTQGCIQKLVGSYPKGCCRQRA